MAATWAKLDQPVADSLSAGLLVVVAFKGWVNGTTEAEVHTQVVDWWRATAGHYASASSRLAFDVFIEIGGIMSNGPAVHTTGRRLCPLITLASDPAKLNALYKDVVEAVRAVSPTRVVAMPPGKLDRPWGLHQLEPPAACNGYCMAEFHIIAAGPCVVNCSDDAGSFAWTGENGTHAEREKLRAAVAGRGSMAGDCRRAACMDGRVHARTLQPPREGPDDAGRAGSFRKLLHPDPSAASNRVERADSRRPPE
eukprot:SAG22_NODE_1296_length_4822_cov_3.066271_4_plen_253_part_00